MAAAASAVSAVHALVTEYDDDPLYEQDAQGETTAASSNTRVHITLFVLDEEVK